MNYQGRPTRKNSDPVKTSADELFSRMDVIRSPGLSVDANEIKDLAKDLFKRLAVFFYKQQMSCLWIAFIGGTGTGKSTLFNAFCGKHLSKTGVERPKTGGPIVYAAKTCPIIRDFPFPNIKLKNQGLDDPSSLPSAGLPGHLLVFTHNRQDWPHLVLLDTPDMDSVETANQKIVEDFYLLSDAIVFVTSQEKYADDVPYQFLLKIGQDEKPCFLLVNKAYEHLTREEILEPLQSQGTSFPKDKMWLIPYSSSNPEQSIMEDSGFRSFVSDFLSQLSPQHTESFHSNQQSKRTRDLTTRIERLIRLLKKENDEAQNWLSQLEDLCKESCHDLIETEKRRFATESRQYLQREIRKLFTKYDPLAKPRRIIRQILFTPFRLLGMALGNSHSAHKDELSKVRQKIDLTPIQGAIGRFNRSVLEKLSPKNEDSPLFRELRQHNVILSDEEIKACVLKEHDLLDSWLEKRFEDLSQGLPRHKRWGIYSTSVLWGILILSFEIVVGGGFSGMDAILDSVLAPFVTKGSMELFAYREIQTVTKELSSRYQEALLSIVHRQQRLYEKVLQGLVTSPQSLEELEQLQEGLEI